MNKGFFFSLSALVFLIFAVSAVTQHLASIRENEIFYSDLMNMISYQTVFSNFNNDSMSATLGATGKFALYKMANYTAYNPITPVGDDNYDNIRAVFQSLINNGTSDVSLFDDTKATPLSYSGQEMNYTLGNISGLLNISLSEIGYRMNEMRFENVNLTMESPYSVRVTADLVADVSDSFGKSEYVVVYKSLNSSVSIEGLPDPLVNRYLYGINGKNQNQNFSWFIFRHSGNTIDMSFHNDSANVTFKGSLAGQGWFYGPLISYEQAKADEVAGTKRSDANLYILYGNLSDIVTLKNWKDYGAYILNSSVQYQKDDSCPSKDDETTNSVFNPVTYDGNCKSKENTAGTHTDKPFVALPGFTLGTLSAKGIDETYFTDDGASMNKRALYFNTGSPAGAVPNSLQEISVYGIEKIRDQFICAYYLHSQYGPNFFQRMFKNGETYSDPDNGLARMLVEKDFLGPSNAYASRSSVDFEFIKGWYDSSSHPMFVIRGMPGCKSIGMCSDASLPVRRIIMSQNVRDEFHVPGYLYCGINDPLCTGAS